MQGYFKHLTDLIHIPGLRGNPQRAYPLTGTGPSFPGTFEVYTAAVVADWSRSSKERVTALSDDLKTLGLTSKIGVTSLDEARVELQVGHMPIPGKSSRDHWVNIADVGFGVSQVLPVLVSLLAAAPGQLVYVEQPELHLHPRAQVALASVLARAAERGVRVVAETHSSWLLLGIQSVVAEGKLPAELVKLHWFTRNERSGATAVKSADLDDAGRFGDWPEDFDDVTLKAQSRYLDAAEAAASSK